MEEKVQKEKKRGMKRETNEDIERSQRSLPEKRKKYKGKERDEIGWDKRLRNYSV